MAQLGQLLLGQSQLGAGDLVDLDQTITSQLAFTSDFSCVILTKEVSSTLSFVSTFSSQLVATRDFASTLSFSSEFTKILPNDFASVLSFTSTFTAVKLKLASVSHPLTIVSTFTPALVINRSLISTLVFGNNFILNRTKALSLTSTFTLTPTITATASKLVHSTLSFSTTVSCVLSKRVNNTLEFASQFTPQLVLNRELNFPLGFNNLFTTGPNTFRRTVNPILNFTSTFVGNKVKPVTSTLAFVSAFSGYKSKPININFSLGQEFTRNCNYGRRLTSRLILQSVFSVQLVKNCTVSTHLELESVFTKRKAILRTVTSELDFNVDIVRSRFFPAFESPLTITSAFAAQRVRTASVQSTLAFTSTFNRQAVLSRTVNVPLLFPDTFDKPVNVGGITSVNLSSFSARKVQIYVTLTSIDNISIILPRPEFDDSENLNASLVILRSRAGTRRVYKKNTNKSTLKYDFVLGTQNVAELKAFINYNNSKAFYLDNWKGELWLVVFKSNPFSFTEAKSWGACGSKFLITLEFEGVHIH